MKYKILQVLERYKHLIAEFNVVSYFEAMERWEKPCTEIEIYAHCKFPVNLPLPRKCREWLIDCKDCEYVDFKVLNEIEAFARELKACGYFVFRNKHWDLLVSKVKSIAYWASQAIPPWRNAGIRGLLFGYTLSDIKEYIERTNEDEIKVNDC